MKTIINHVTDPHFNLALEEYVFKNLDCEEDILLLWQNEPSVILGRNQIVFREVNIDYCKEKNIPIIRRISGGGTVYHDLGNLNYSIITKNYEDVISNYRYFTKPLIDFLNHLGVKASFSGKSDIVIDSKKFSGNAQFYHNKRLLHHGTILFNTNLDTLKQTIRSLDSTIKSAGVHSNRTVVTNVTNHLNPLITIEEFKSKLLSYWLNRDYDKIEPISLTHKDLEAIQKLKSEKYMHFFWNYGESPDFEIIKKIEEGEVQLNVKNGLISSFKIIDNINEFNTDSLIGLKFDRDIILNTLNSNTNLKNKMKPFINAIFK